MVSYLLTVITKHRVKSVGKLPGAFNTYLFRFYFYFLLFKSEEVSEEGEVPDYGFGQAKHFMPLPNTVVGSHCAWEIRLNTLEGRIPGKIH